jgi:hypothetical protein
MVTRDSNPVELVKSFPSMERKKCQLLGVRSKIMRGEEASFAPVGYTE